ncbi:MOSC domain-containing protein [Cohnella fermenti]|uniref:MOSC domain-containing protein n=1 Tax=Cohnella fermenti TaxID=2565925 RepID=A0A4S4BWN7_9BACL|nr:MOSC domain-containing protein [Cohnella fermenti]THF79501.1 MOSC domain-containing protein [Cohnella fermenti]
MDGRSRANEGDRLVSINTGKAKVSSFKGKEARSGIWKAPAGEVLALAPEGFEGDEQADLVNHGGPDKAVCVYSLIHYPHWESVLGRRLPIGAFGENFTVAGLSEDDVHIGDVYRIGDAVVQVSQPRQPCWKLAMKWGMDELPALVTERGATGFYFRVIEPGVVRTGEFELVERHPAGISVTEANRIMHKDRADKSGIRKMLGLGALSDSWRGTFAKRLARLEGEAE